MKGYSELALNDYSQRFCARCGEDIPRGFSYKNDPVTGLAYHLGCAREVYSMTTPEYKSLELKVAPLEKIVWEIE